MNNGTLLCIGLYDDGGTLCSIKGTESKILDENVYYFEVYGDVAAYYKKPAARTGFMTSICPKTARISPSALSRRQSAARLPDGSAAVFE